MNQSHKFKNKKKRSTYLKESNKRIMSDDKKATQEETNIEDVPLKARHSGKKAFT